jgi:hypothetical protein
VAADIEADRGVEGRVLVDENEGKLILDLVVVVGGLEVPVLNAGFGDRVHDAVDELTDAVLAANGPKLSIEVLACHDIGSRLRPARWYGVVDLLDLILL